MNITAKKHPDLEHLLKTQAVWPATASGDKITHQPNPTVIPFAIPEIDSALPTNGLSSGTLHEFCLKELTSQPSKSRGIMPAFIPTLLAANALKQRWQQLGREPESKPFMHYLTWVNRHSWPAPFIIARMLGQCQYQSKQAQNHLVDLTANCLFIDPPTPALTLWTLELLLRSPIVTVLISTIPKLSFAFSRRLATAAKHSGSTSLLLVPYKQCQQPSCAASRWSITPYLSASGEPCWQLELLHWKGAQPNQRTWIIEQSYEYPNQPTYYKAQTGTLVGRAIHDQPTTATKMAGTLSAALGG